MIGLGTLINVVAIVVGGTIGLYFGSRLKKSYQDSLLSVCGLCTMFLGIAGTLEKMYQIKEIHLVSTGTMMILLSYALGTFLGTYFELEEKIEKFGEYLKIKAGSSNDEKFVNAFVIASLTVCIGAMAVVGAIQDGINKDISILSAKAILDFVIIMIMAASLGKGCVFSAIPVGIFQAVITLLAVFIEPVLTEQAIHNLSLTGSMLIFCVGVNLIFGRKFPVANMLPTLLFAVAFAYVPAFN